MHRSARGKLFELGNFAFDQIGSIERVPRTGLSHSANRRAEAIVPPEPSVPVPSPVGLPTKMAADIDALAFFRGFINALPIALCMWGVVILAWAYLL
jgi:hypothetical protein